MDVRKLSALAVAAAMAATPSQAAVIGWFDAIHVSMVDTPFGWICESSNPTVAPPGNLVIYTNGPAGTGYLYYEVSVANMWGTNAGGYGYRPDVPNSGQCTGNNYTGWAFGPSFVSGNPTIHVYYRDTGGTLHELNGSGKNCNGQQLPGYCY